MLNVALKEVWFVCQRMGRTAPILKYASFVNAVGFYISAFLSTLHNILIVAATTEPTTKATTVQETIERCDVMFPNKEDPDSCRFFYQCEPGINGTTWIKKECGPGTFYNPQMQVCDFEENVVKLKPSCGGPGMLNFN